MFGITTLRRLRDEIDAHLATIRRSLTAENLRAEAQRNLLDEVDAHIATIRARREADDALAAEQRTTRLLAEQLLVATSEKNPAARAALGLPEEGPWDRAVEGLNALVDADVAFHIEPDGHISNPLGDEHIEWDRDANRWRLVHDDDTDLVTEPTKDGLSTPETAGP
ncbi:hypothetical protein ACGFZC_07440 [[Kitasatospora] papulosa]|uniref:hypothetical protein n=1 Tax=Streptomyces TaxID=1883 RepID=UPI000566E606|nr:hypothetical protein [Streptomyces sp. NRRL S-325]